METATKQWLRYWRNSLADAESGAGAMSEDDLGKLHRVSNGSLQAGRLPPGGSVLAELFSKEPDEVSVVRIVFRPTAYRAVLEHNKLRSGLLPAIVTPVVCSLWVSREGWLIPAEPPVIPRDLLEPQPQDTFALASVEEQDRFLTERQVRCWSEQEVVGLVEQLKDGTEAHQRLWEPYYKLTVDLFSELCHTDKLKDGYVNCRGSYLQKVDDLSNAAVHMLKCYDWLAESSSENSLIERYALGETSSYSPCVDALETLSQRVGHPGSQFPLAKAQRDALAQTLALEDGEILAINGPPGTGKTTFVLSAVASLWIKAALEESEPPLIVAASTNNQAVTNVLDAFAKGFEASDSAIGGRWLSRVESFGGYFPARSKEAAAASRYQTPGFYRDLENPEYRVVVETEFLAKAQTALEDVELTSVSAVKDRLHQKLEALHQQLVELEEAARRRSTALRQCLEALGEWPEQAVTQEKQHLEALVAQREPIQANWQGWKRHCAEEPLWLGLLVFLKPVARKRHLRRELFIIESFTPEARELVKPNPDADVDEVLRQWLDQQDRAISAQRLTVDRLQRCLDKRDATQAKWQRLVWAVCPEKSGKLDPEAVDQYLDTSLRFELFQWSVHYWEARWLLDCEEQQKELANQTQRGREKTGLKSVIPRWRRRMKLTPCIVSTLHALPSHMTYSVFEGDDNFRNDYLVGEIDLLIIDEGGQVAPEVAGASFALAKKALVIGDIHQISPVYKQSRSSDVGNLLETERLASVQEYAALRKTGRCAVEGSVMRVAQTTSPVHYLPAAEPGMFLREHRRCFDPIIAFCNDLCYQGQLIPKRGEPDEESQMGWPAMGYLHIDGRCESPAEGSRANPLEASVVAEWLADQRAALEQRYQKPLEEIVGVVTPFKAQERLITEGCSQRGIAAGRGAGEMTVGTVHALQGAERPVVLFSAVYSRHNDGQFIDRDASMLNVAVSRAKDSFLIFGDMDVIGGAAQGTARALLNNHLKSRDDSELAFSPGPRPDLLASCRQPVLINNAEEHDEWTNKLLDQARQHVEMISPWVSYSRLREIGLLDKMRTAIERDVAVTLYTDYRFNTHTANRYDEAKAVGFKQCCQALEALGVTVCIVHQVHSKLIMVDDRLMCVGSYNWASAARTGKYKNMETSILYSGNLQEEARLQREALISRELQQDILVA